MYKITLRKWSNGEELYSHTSNKNTTARTIKIAVDDGVNIQGIDAKDANIMDFDFGSIDLRGSNFSNSDFECVDFSKALLAGCVFDRASFYKVSLPFSTLEEMAESCSIDNANFNNCKWLGQNNEASNQ